MEKVDKHISELLYKHDCVIVPDFGGFVANYASAKIHPTQHTFTPPSKSIVFNKNLKNNDGLLANHIVIVENTNYTEAIKLINHFVENINAELRKGAKVKVNEVGTLFLDVERNIQFQPADTNYLLDAFGLAQFQSPAIKRDNITKRLEKEFSNRTAIAPEKKKINYKRYVAIAMVVPLIALLVWVPMKTDLLKNINYSNLNPFSKKVINVPEVKVIPKTTKLPVVKEEPRTEKEETKIVKQELVVEPVKADSLAVVKSNDINLDFKFHIVVGCFQIETNAINFVNTLQQQNLNASIIGKNNKDLFVVSCGNYATNKEAASELEIIRKQQPNAWLYKN